MATLNSPRTGPIKISRGTSAQSGIQLIRGSMQPYDAVRRQAIHDQTVEFAYNPSTVSVSISPNFEYKVAAQGGVAFAQYGNSEPVKITFSLLIRENKESRLSADTSSRLAALRFLAENPVLSRVHSEVARMQGESVTGSPPPLVKLQMGLTLKWLGRTPIGTISDLGINITEQYPDLSPKAATVAVTFTESNVGQFKPTRGF